VRGQIIFADNETGMLRTGVIGNEFAAAEYIRQLRNMRSVKLTGIVDDQQAHELSVDRVIAESEAVFILSDPSSLFALAEKAIRSSRHVFLDSLFPLHVREVKALNKLAREADVNVQIGHTDRFNPAFLAAKHHLQHPMLIESHRLTEFDPSHSEMSVIYDLMLSDIDIALSLVKSNVKRISSSGVAVLSDQTDIANTRIEFDNGAVANLTASRISMKEVKKSRFFGRDSFLTVDYLAHTITQVHPGKNFTKESIEQLDNNKLKNNILASIEVPAGNALNHALESFVSSIHSNLPPVVPLVDGLKTLEVAHKIVDQLRLNTNFAPGYTISA
jgi:predicted dehydrogenase